MLPNDLHKQSQDRPILKVIQQISRLDNVPNGINRKQFPNLLIDRTIILACEMSNKENKKIRIMKMENTVCGNPELFFTRYPEETEADHENCTFFITIDSVTTANSNLESNLMMICDVRDNFSPVKWISDEMTGFWVRIFGPKNKFTFQISLWQLLGGKQTGRLQKSRLKKINELEIDICNAGPITRNKPVKKVVFGINASFEKKNFVGCKHYPSFCPEAVFLNITSSLQTFLENGKTSEFSESYESFCKTTQTSDDNNSAELKLLLSIEKSQLHSTKAEFVKAKQLLQKVVNNIVSKCPNRTFLLNRAYSALANVHLMEGNFGTAEDCLNFLQNDKKNGVPFEDVGFFYLLNGEMLMNFSKKTPEMRERLISESDSSFIKAEEALKMSLPAAFDRLCKLDLLRARLYICEHYGTCCGSNFEKANAFRKKVEEKTESLSLRSKCHLYLVQSECYFYEGNFQEAKDTLCKCKEMFELFPEFIVIHKKIEQQREVVSTLNGSSCLKQLEINNAVDLLYDADESS